MGRKKIAGLFKKKDIWHIDKHIGGKRVCRSTGTSRLVEAEQFLINLMEETRQAQVYGIRPKRTFKEAAARYVIDKQHKRSIDSDVSRLNMLMPLLGNKYLDELHMGTLQKWIDHRRTQKVKSNTINHGLKVVRQILNLAASEWIDEHGLTWLLAAPKVKLLPLDDKAEPYPLTWDEQRRLFNLLPAHLHDMALFAVNTGCRDQEICNLRWDWEVKVPEMGISVFIIPKGFVKNKQDRLVVLNQVARKVVDSRRGTHLEYVFSYRGHRLQNMLSSGWKVARIKAGLKQVRVHDLKHTFGYRLRAAKVSFEDRQDLLGHKSNRMTTHYSAAELGNLFTAAEKVCESSSGEKPNVVILRLAS